LRDLKVDLSLVQSGTLPPTDIRLDNSIDRPKDANAATLTMVVFTTSKLTFHIKAFALT
jgi:hypothetical protein